ncbi:MAG: 4-demethylwyosine synthase TYW1 [Methanomicrobiaceae archaeon]|uniref:Fe-s oxidoreductase n=1 Tax=hydrocarbon metagenome TaxID=938273 RepID=A0A0W8FFM7_9ZZZZ|nr:4-demethylwyosine synthase TYW1 [Methanomicrobiaceae archaeon]MDD5420218.1 4-demethylwyosine synthase TYW1 [Methanomicrobiaceae archaeon]
MHSEACEALKRQGYQFFTPTSSAALKPCMWNKRALRGGEMCYKHRFYGIESHRCIQMTPTLRCNQRCLFCWRSFEHEVTEEEECPPEVILASVKRLQKKALSGYKVSSYVEPERFSEALDPNMVAISLSGEPTCYSALPELIDRFRDGGYTTFLVSNGTRPDVLARCRPTQVYISLDAPDRETYLRICRPRRDYWERIGESLALLGSRRSAIRITLVEGENDFAPDRYAAMIQDSGASFVEVKGYMHLGYSRYRLERDQMPLHDRVRAFADLIAEHCDYAIRDESPVSRVVCLEQRP